MSHLGKVSHHSGKGVTYNSTYSLLSNCLIKLTAEGVALCLELIIQVCGDWSGLDGEHSFAR